MHLSVIFHASRPLKCSVPHFILCFLRWNLFQSLCEYVMRKLVQFYSLYRVCVRVCTVTSFSYICDLSHSIKKHSIILLTHILFGLFISFIGINFENTISCYDNNKKQQHTHENACRHSISFHPLSTNSISISIIYVAYVICVIFEFVQYSLRLSTEVVTFLQSFTFFEFEKKNPCSSIVRRIVNYWFIIIDHKSNFLHSHFEFSLRLGCSCL